MAVKGATILVIKSTLVGTNIKPNKKIKAKYFFADYAIKLAVKWTV